MQQKFSSNFFKTQEPLTQPFKNDIFIDTIKKNVQTNPQTTKDEDLISGHSWFGKTCHIIRADGHTLRCEVREIILRPSFVGVRVRYRENGKSKKKNYSPIFLACMHSMWWNQQIVSEDDDTTIDAVDNVLPLLRLLKTEESRLSSDQKLCLQWTLEQSDCIIKIIS